jgi:thiamine biosynthesis lipoprotein
MENPEFNSKGILPAENTIKDLHRFSHQAMNTVFDIYVCHADGEYARQAAQAAFEMCDVLEGKFSRFIPNSEISLLNASAAQDYVAVSLEVYECIEISNRMSKETAGAFDPTMTPALLKTNDSEDELPIGMDFVELDKTEHSIRFVVPGIMLDLGAVGKGYAVERMAGVLKEWEIGSAMISGGLSSICTSAAPAGLKGWAVAIRHPLTKKIVNELEISNICLSGSGLEKGNHIIDPRTGRPATNTLAAWCMTKSAAVGDALSTAMMVMSIDETRQYFKRNPEQGGLLIMESEIHRFGSWK